ncbi:MAG: hypothetical protein AAF559_14155 [Pseudomonadota bacterium]
MILSYIVAAPIAMASMAAQTPVEIETLTFSDVEKQSSDFADTLVTSYACDVLGYSVDYEGLADYGYEIRDNFVAFGMEQSEAMERMQSDIRKRRARFNRFEGSFLRFRVDRFTDFDGYSPQGQFRHRYGRRCNRLTQSQKVGYLLTKPEDRISMQELNANLRDLQSENVPFRR